MLLKSASRQWASIRARWLGNAANSNWGAANATLGSIRAPLASIDHLLRLDCRFALALNRGARTTVPRQIVRLIKQQGVRSVQLNTHYPCNSRSPVVADMCDTGSHFFVINKD